MYKKLLKANDFENHLLLYNVQDKFAILCKMLYNINILSLLAKYSKPRVYIIHITHL